jgi:hypothetical protein
MIVHLNSAFKQSHREADSDGQISVLFNLFLLEGCMEPVSRDHY